MRYDYALYGIAIIFFIITAISFVVVSEQNGKNLWTVSTVVFGLLFASAGYLLKPKSGAPAVNTSTITQAVISESSPQAPIAEVPAVEIPKIETTPMPEIPTANIPAAETPSVQTIAPNATIEAPVSVTSSIESPASAIKEAVANIPEIMDLTQIKGIGEKRSAQLKANGINSIQDLAKINANDLAAKLQISPKIVKKWVTNAKQIIK